MTLGSIRISRREEKKRKKETETVRDINDSSTEKIEIATERSLQPEKKYRHEEIALKGLFDHHRTSQK